MLTRTSRTFALAFALILATGCAAGRTASTEQATVAQQLFLFQYSRGPAWRDGVPMRQQGLGPHGAYMQQLQSEGRLYAGGGYASDDGGMAIITAANIEEARAILAADPAIVSGIFVAELREWRPRFRSDAPLPQSN
ncbi:MAG: YciI family protein [Hyphomonadaceae bacterium]